METEKNILFDESISLLKEGMAKKTVLEFHITSNSMSPILEYRDKFLAQRTTFGDLRCGDIVVFKSNGGLTAHRFLKRINSSAILTKGDCSKETDLPLSQESIVAKVKGVKKYDAYLDFDTFVWKKTNFLLGVTSLLETAHISRIIKTPVVIFLKNIIKLINPFYHQQNKDLSLEKNLVFILSQRKINEDGSEKIRAYLDRRLDWSFIYQLILYNNIGPLAFRHLEKMDKELIPKWIVDNLKESYTQNFLKNASTFKDVANLLRTFHKQGVEVIILKGLALADKLYKDFSLRPMGDVDILVKRQDWLKIRNILDKQGFRNEEGLDLLKLVELSEMPMNWHLCYKNISGTKLELKFNIFLLDFPDFSDTASHWQEAQPLRIRNQNTLTLSLENHILYLAVRMLNVGFRHLLWFGELKELLRLHKNIDWVSIIDKAKSRKVEAAVYYTFRILNDEFGAEIPEDMLKQLEPSGLRKLSFRLFFGIKDLGLRNPIRLQASPNSLIVNFLFLNKLTWKASGARNILYYIFRLIIPPIDYVVYRYQIPKWQAFLGKGYMKRIKLLGLKMSQAVKYMFIRH